MNRPLPDHGTYARYAGRSETNRPGCRCHECFAAGRRYLRRRNYLHQTGRPLSVPADKARAHLRSLMAAGAGWNQISEASGGMSKSTIKMILSGDQATIHRTTESRVLNLRLGDVRSARPIPAFPAARRLQALQAIGHSVPAMAGMCSLGIRALEEITSGKRSHVTPQTIRKVEALYDQVSMTPGPAKAVATLARRKAWAPPLSWDDNALDSPDGYPDWTGACGTPQGYQRHGRDASLPSACKPCKKAWAQAKASRAGLAA